MYYHYVTNIIVVQTLYIFQVKIQTYIHKYTHTHTHTHANTYVITW